VVEDKLKKQSKKTIEHILDELPSSFRRLAGLISLTKKQISKREYREARETITDYIHKVSQGLSEYSNSDDFTIQTYEGAVVATGLAMAVYPSPAWIVMGTGITYLLRKTIEKEKEEILEDKIEEMVEDIVDEELDEQEEAEGIEYIINYKQGQAITA